ncbi:hypothetical protein BDP81DRAFT_15298 [Colletotrichum phormii]|uniref:Uncharacterized protein n=1 Tax=Colletotrichum phormii TaxID=359342 RepID=A0AAJ0EM00_9PEZI|nr:uncharacterized protein BDP81DRAFT_15298 [Colletotrichum phormii]KAK1656087.1 hypothetical protein BDP81DRAFT_15298 [Colletotrichum phormii]
MRLLRKQFSCGSATAQARISFRRECTVLPIPGFLPAPSLTSLGRTISKMAPPFRCLSSCKYVQLVVVRYPLKSRENLLPGHLHCTKRYFVVNTDAFASATIDLNPLASMYDKDYGKTSMLGTYSEGSLFEFGNSAETSPAHPQQPIKTPELKHSLYLHNPQRRLSHRR